MTNHHSQILKNVRGSEKETGMYNYLTNRRINYYKNVAKLVSKRDFCKKNYDAVLSNLKQDVQMLEYVMQT